MPLLFGHFLGRLNRACVEYTTGAGSPGISLRFINIVPKDESPVARVLKQMLGPEVKPRVLPSTLYPRTNSWAE